GAGRGAGGNRRVRLRQPARRPRLRLDRPARGVLVSAAGGRATPRRRENPAGRFFSRLARNPVGLLGFVVAVFVLLAAALGPELTPYDPLRQSIRERFQGPSAAHWLGTDNFGRDTLTRVLHG